MSQQSQERYDRLEDLKQRAAEALQLPIDHAKVVMLAALRLQHEALLERLVAGGKVDAAALLTLTETIDKLAPTLPPLPKVELSIVRGRVDVCPQCGYTAPTTKPESGGVVTAADLKGLNPAENWSASRGSSDSEQAGWRRFDHPGW